MKQATDTSNKEKIPFTLRHASLITGLAVGLALAFAFGTAMDKYERHAAASPQVIGADVPAVPAAVVTPAGQVPAAPMR
jgi:ABC-type Fe3+-siderophore transport system permease subunit